MFSGFMRLVKAGLQEEGSALKGSYSVPGCWMYYMSGLQDSFFKSSAPFL